MGIQGLLPFVKSASKPVNVKEFKGCTAAIDTYCWLHKGAFSCAEKLIKGEKTDGYVAYVIKMANMLISAGVRPILVFDGQRLPSKRLTEEKRREQRELNKRKAKQFLIEGKIKEARECYQRAVDVTPEMAFEVIQACRSRGIDYIVAPYEADAQLAYLTKMGIADVVITEDSDLILFGCDKIIFKMDQGGYGILVEKSRLGDCLGNSAEKFTHEKFRQMCVLSGCDYLPSLPGIGLAKACKFFKLITHPDLRVTLPRLPAYLKMPQLSVSEEYLEDFLRAENTFLYQLVFCPTSNKLVPLNPYPPDINPEELTYAGRWLPDEQAFQMAIGNINVNTHARMDFYCPPERKVLRDHNAAMLKKSEAAKWTKISAFEPIVRRPRDGPSAAKSPARRAYSLPTKENKSPEKRKVLEARTSSLVDTRPTLSENDTPDTAALCSPVPSTPPTNMFKVASKPPALRSRFFSAPPGCSKKKEAGDKPHSLLSALEDGCNTPRARKNIEQTYPASKFQWRRTPFGEPPTVSELQSTCSTLTPFKKLRMSMARTTTSPEGGSSQESSDPVSQEVSGNEQNADTNPSKISVGRNAVASNTGNGPRGGTLERENALTRIRNPFAKSLSLASLLTVTEKAKKVDLASEDKNPMPNSVPTDPSLLVTKGRRLKADFALEFEDESPSSERTCTTSSPDQAASTGKSVCEAELNGDERRFGCEESDDDETPWPASSAGARLRDNAEAPLSCLDDIVTIEDDADAAEAKKDPVSKGSARALQQPRQAKKAPSKPRRLGLSKAKPKKDLCQPSIVETLAKYKFKR